jgi:antitoxin CptB
LETQVTNRSSEGLDARRRRLLFRSWHRGIREVDLILGRFADARLAAMGEVELDEYEELIDVPTPVLLAWVMGGMPIPPDATPLLREMIDFHLKAKPAP